MDTVKRIQQLFLMLILITGLYACGGGDDDPDVPPPPPTAAKDFSLNLVNLGVRKISNKEEIIVNVDTVRSGEMTFE